MDLINGGHLSGLALVSPWVGRSAQGEGDNSITAFWNVDFAVTLKRSGSRRGWPGLNPLRIEKEKIKEFICVRFYFIQYSTIWLNIVRKLLDRTFGALADPTRRRILAQLAKGEECVTDLARPHAMSLAAVSKHLIVLEKAGLVKRRRDGRVHSLALEAKPMQEAQAWIDRYRKFWEGNLDQFEKYLDKLQKQGNQT